MNPVAINPLRLLPLIVTMAGLGAAPAAADTVQQPVTANVVSSLSLTSSAPATFTSSFAPGQTATTTGALTVTDTNPSWTLQVADAGSGAGHMVAAATGCTGSSPQLSNPLSVTVTGPTGVTSSGAIAIGGSGQTVATGSVSVAAAALNADYTQVILATQLMTTGCVYSLTATYTLQ